MKKRIYILIFFTVELLFAYSFFMGLLYLSDFGKNFYLPFLDFFTPHAKYLMNTTQLDVSFISILTMFSCIALLFCGAELLVKIIKLSTKQR